jgi:hypothetical protein
MLLKNKFSKKVTHKYQKHFTKNTTFNSGIVHTQPHKALHQREINSHNQDVLTSGMTSSQPTGRNKLPKTTSSKKNKFSQSGCLDNLYDINIFEAQYTHMHPYSRHIN